jgi:tRNA (guanine37-N1)-methyltransferase
VTALRIDTFTIFPEVVEAYCAVSVLGRGCENGSLDLRSHDLRLATKDRHRTVDDTPFGGGAGMVLKPEPVFEAVEAVEPPRPLILLGPGGDTFDQTLAAELALSGGFSLLCGRYEGVDERIRSSLVDRELSVGDYVLAGGEVAAMVVIEAVCRLVPGVLGNARSSEDETFTDDLLEYPQWTRPAEFRGQQVPEILRSGDHGKVERWRRCRAVRTMDMQRPDLLSRRGISAEEYRWLEEFDLTVGLGIDPTD